MAHDVIELKTGMSVPVPIEGEGRALSDATQNLLIGKVSIGKPNCHLPRSQTDGLIAIAGLDVEEVLKRFYSPDDTQFAIPRNVLARKKVGKVKVATVEVEIVAPEFCPLQLEIHEFPSHLESPIVQDRFNGKNLIGFRTRNPSRIQPTLVDSSLWSCAKASFVLRRTIWAVAVLVVQNTTAPDITIRDRSRKRILFPLAPGVFRYGHNIHVCELKKS